MNVYIKPVLSVPSVQNWSNRALWNRVLSLDEDCKQVGPLYEGLVLDNYHKDVYYLSKEKVHYVCPASVLKFS